MPNYLPFDDRVPDSQYQDMLAEILTQGEAVPTRQGISAYTVIQLTQKYQLTNGFPVITCRNVASFWNRGIGELCAFINGVTTSTELKAYGANWWGAWTTPEKTQLFGLPDDDIGPASYGGAFARFPTLDGGTFDQFDNLVRQIKELPNDRVHVVSGWMPKENARGEGFVQSNTIAPCHGVFVHVRVIGGKLHLHMLQRSADVPVGVPSNMIQYAALMLMLEHLTGYEAGTFYHTLSDAHIYSDQASDASEMVRRKPLPLPTVQLTAEGRQITNIKAFRREHFELSDYEAHPSMSKIPVAT